MCVSLKAKGLLLGLFSTCCWGSFYPVSRFLFGKDEALFDPFFATLLRIAAAAMILMPLALTPQWRSTTVKALKKDWRMLLLLALAGIIGEGQLVFLSLKFTTAAHASLMANTSPIFTVFLAFLLLKTPIGRDKILGMIAGLSGVVLIFSIQSGGDVFSGNASLLTGDLLAMGSGIAWSLFTVLGERVAREYGGLVSMAILFSFGTILMLPIVWMFAGSLSLDFPLRVWAGIAYLGIFGCGLANLFWYRALEYVQSDELGSFGFLSAFLAVFSSILCLGEKITWVLVASGCMILSGVWLMIRQPSPTPRPEKVKSPAGH